MINSHNSYLATSCSVLEHAISDDSLGWTFRGSAYCQLIRDANKRKRLEWARQYASDDFEDVIWADEASVQLETPKTLNLSLTQNIPLRFMYGLGSTQEEQPKFAYLKESWMLNFTLRF